MDRVIAMVEMMEVCGRQRGDGDVNSHLTLIERFNSTSEGVIQ